MMTRTNWTGAPATVMLLPPSKATSLGPPSTAKPALRTVYRTLREQVPCREQF